MNWTKNVHFQLFSWLPKKGHFYHIFGSIPQGIQQNTSIVWHSYPNVAFKFPREFNKMCSIFSSFCMTSWRRPFPLCFMFYSLGNWTKNLHILAFFLKVRSYPHFTCQLSRDSNQTFVFVFWWLPKTVPIYPFFVQFPRELTRKRDFSNLFYGLPKKAIFLHFFVQFPRELNKKITYLGNLGDKCRLLLKHFHSLGNWLRVSVHHLWVLFNSMGNLNVKCGWTFVFLFNSLGNWNVKFDTN